jgi:hypothetical protein
VRTYLDARDPSLVATDRHATMVQFADASDDGIDDIVAEPDRKIRREMANSSDTTQVEPPAAAADLKALGDRLVGSWEVSGEAEGETSWEWMEGGFFLVQRGWSRREGNEQTYVQIIGYDRFPGSAPAEEITGVCTPTTAIHLPTSASSTATR